MGLATELAPEEATVNVVALGFVPATEFWTDRLTPESQASHVAEIPADHPGTPEVVAAAVAYLAAPDAGWATGQILQVKEARCSVADERSALTAIGPRSA